LVGVLLAIPVVLIVLHTIVRIVRHFHKFPMPEFMADLIDHPLRVANVYNLPFEDGTFDAVYMIAVIGEIPEPRRAMQEFHRGSLPIGHVGFQ
jgi:hypothetical protein